MALDHDVDAEVWQRLAKGETPHRIVEEMSRDPIFAARVPDLRTVQRRRSTLRVPSGPDWSLAEADDRDAATLLPILGFLRAAGVLMWLHRPVATWLACVLRAAPALEVTDALAFAARYAAADHRQEGHHAIDEDLADVVYRRRKP